MINFRYHIVSLVAVFLALSVGIVLGVSLRGPVDEGLAQEADQDRKQVRELRTELDQQTALANYRDAYASAVGAELGQDQLTGRSVALVVMPDAPGGVVSTISAALIDAGATLTHTVRVNADAFDPAKAETVSGALASHRSTLQLSDSMSEATMLGLAVGRSVFARQTTEQDADAAQVEESLLQADLVDVGGRSNDLAEIAVVVTAETTEPALEPEVLQAHVEMDVALQTRAAGVVLAGPNSEGVAGTDVLTARSTLAASRLSTVDVADLPSGVTTTVLAAKEQWLGRHGDYGALTRADGPLPELPVR